MSAAVQERAPTVAITSVLVANRGEIASRVFSTAREMGLRTVAVYADPDADLPFVRHADVAVRLPGSSATETYLAIDALLDAAARTGADAVHPGYGFLAESAAFAQAVIDAGLAWVGPPPGVIAAMGDKIEAKRIAAEAGVPLLPSTVLEGDDPTTWQAALDGAGVGWPALVKAAAGGGGRGMRIVESADDLAEAVTSARREAESAFGDGAVFAERLVRGGRHVEVQVFGDPQGNVLHLGERECSIQRRHQKIVEEAPSPGITPAVRERLLESGVALARHIRYVNAGTIEYLVDGDGDDAEFFFLEMNTRLQVEHRVTEAVTQLDLVALQLAVAAGDSLRHAQEEIHQDGHAIEVRLYAEDPGRDFAPSFGRMERFGPGEAGLVLVDTTVEDGSVVSTSFDPMVAKLTRSAATRSDTARELANALRNAHLHGPITNRDLLVAILEHPAFLAGNTTTDFLDRFPEVFTAGPTSATRRTHEAAAALVRNHLRQTRSPWPFASAGWRNVGSSIQGPAGGARLLRLDADRDEPDTWIVTFELDGLTHTAGVHLVGDPAGDTTAYVNTADGQTEWTEAPRFTDPGAAAAAGSGPLAPVPGTVVSIEVAVGDEVEAGQTLVVLEAMKMEHRITAAVDGTVDAVLVVPGDRVDAHQPLVRLT